jgi:anti-sigma B factor antagonist
MRDGKQGNVSDGPRTGTRLAARMPPATELQIADQALDERTHVIALVGQVDLYSAPEFKQRTAEVIEQGKSRIVVDLSRVSFMDSTGLSVLVGALKRLRLVGGALAVVSANEDTLRLFEITGLNASFPIAPSREQAVQALDGLNN